MKDYSIIEGRRWFSKSTGNTYHTVQIINNGHEVFDTSPVTYGYEEQYIQTAADMLGMTYCELRDAPWAVFRVLDVPRKKDLHHV